MRDVYVRIGDAKVFASRNDFLKDFLRDKKVRLLDVGNLGEGEEHVHVSTLIEQNGGEHVGLDINANLAETLHKRNQIVGDLHNLKGVVADASFDCVYGGQIIEHSWRPGDMIAECHRILTSDGYLVLDTPNAFDAINLIRVFFMQKDTLGFDINVLTYNEAKDNFTEFRGKGEVLSQPQHKIFYGPAMLRQLLNMHGFTVEYFAYIAKPRNILHRLFLTLFPQGAQKIAVVARKKPLEEIFDIVS